MNEVTENPAEHRFELPIEPGAIATANYSFAGPRIVLTHTVVPKEFEGQGVASRLARGVFDAIRASGRKVVLECPFMTAYYKRHPEYADIVSGGSGPGGTT